MSAAHREYILSQTLVATPALCPEIRLRLVTAACPLWTASAADLERLRLPDPFWAFAWPGGQALARHLLDHPGLVRGRRVLDVGAGSALQAIAALKSGASSALAADIDPFAVEAAEINAELNGVALEVTSDDRVGTGGAGYDVVLAGDMFYDPQLAARLSDWLGALARAGATVLVGDPGRGHLPTAGLSLLGQYETPPDADCPGASSLSGVFALEAS